MSLHGKIVAWFVFFAALTVMLFGLGDHLQSTQALRFALEGRALSLATQVVSEVERRYDRVESDLLAFGYAVSAASGTGLAAESVPAGFTRIAVYDGGTAVLAMRDTTTALPTGPCSTELVHFAVDLTDGEKAGHRVEASMPAARFFAGTPAVTARLGRNGITAVLRASDGATVFDAGCGLGGEAGLPALREALRRHAMALRGTSDSAPVLRLLEGIDSRERALAAAVLPDPDWAAVVTVDYDEFAAPFVAARTKQVALMAAAMLPALLIVLRGIRKDMTRLTAISRAAEAIGHGRFDVWLPPPTSDEIGRLSLALGRMVDRLSRSLRQIEITRSIAAVGELSTYLSHEIRNPLSSIRLNLQMLRRELTAGSVPDDGAELVGLCLTELQRLDDVVRTVLEVGRRGRGTARGECDAHAVIHDTLRVMHRTLEMRAVKLETRLMNGDARAGMDAAALRSVLLNLLLNAMDAVSGAPEKRIRIATEQLEIDGASRWLVVSVSDSGPGVPAHLRERIFDPFFTTKPSGNGIGLPTALGAAQECGGLLRYAPAAESSGAEFVLELPLVGMTSGAAADWPAGADGPAAADPMVAAK